MPYPRPLQQYMQTEWSAEPPSSWETRLREISPRLERCSHLRFRWFDPHDHWMHPERGVWALYACTPRAIVTKDRARCFDKHWSELPASQQAGLKSVVSDYQHFMWHTQGLDVRPFWILQGEWGGTPAQYSRREERYLDAAGAMSEPYPLGFFPAVPFTERAVTLILERDRLVQYGDKLDQADDAKRETAEFAEAEKSFRQKFLDMQWETLQPQIEFMKSQKAKAELAGLDVPNQTKEQEVVSATWRDHFLEFGTMPGASQAGTRALQVAVR